MIHTISFPGLGIDEFQINSVAFSLFGRDIAWYGIIVTCGILAAFLYTLYRAQHNEGIAVDHVYDIAIFTVIFGIIGARAYYVLTNLDYYTTFSSAIAIWNGGLAIYGGIIAGALTILIVTRIHHIDCRRFFDAVAPGVMLGQIIGRWGNFVNAEAFGYETTLPWRMGIGSAGHETIYVHPTFLYESLWNLLGFLMINALYKRKKYNGQIFLMYITWYGFGRMFIEGLRTDSLWIFHGTVRISQLVGFLTFAIGLITMIICGCIAHRNASIQEESKEIQPHEQKMVSDAIAHTQAMDMVSAAAVNDEETQEIQRVLHQVQHTEETPAPKQEQDTQKKNPEN